MIIFKKHFDLYIKYCLYKLKNIIKKYLHKRIRKM